MYWISTYVSSLEVSETTAWKMIGSSRKNRAPTVVYTGLLVGSKENVVTVNHH